MNREKVVTEAVDREEMDRLLNLREAEDDYNRVLNALKVVSLATKYPQTIVSPAEIAKPLLMLARVINERQRTLHKMPLEDIKDE